MANTKHRIHRVVALTAFAAAALLVGPHATLGLDTGVVSGTLNQVGTTTQAVVETTQQTVDSTVTTVESTTQAVQQTVQTTVEQAPASVPAAAPVVTAAPAPSAPDPQQTSSPTRRSGARTTAPGAALRGGDSAREVRRDSSTKLASATEAVRSGAGKAADRTGASSLAGKRSTSSRRSTRALSSDEPATSCLPAGVPELLAALQLRSILSVLCATVELPGRTAPTTPAVSVGGSGSDAGTSTVKTLGRVLGVVAAVAAPTTPLALFAPDEIRLQGSAAGSRAGVAAGIASGASVVPGAGRSGAPTSAAAHGAGQPIAAGSQAGELPTESHNPVQGSSDGSRNMVSATSALATILAFDLALLTLLLGYRAARRWVIPRFV